MRHCEIFGISFVALFKNLSLAVKKKPHVFFQAAFLEIQSPDLLEALQAVFERGADDVVIVPYFLQVGKHVALHVPALVLEAQTRYPNKTIRLSGHLGFDERIVSVVRDLIREARTAS